MSEKSSENPKTDIPRQIIQLPNVTLPIPDGITIKITEHIQPDVKRSDLKVVYVWGDFEDCEDGIKIRPTEPGDYEVDVMYLHNGVKYVRTYKQTVNQDPKKLWNRVDPPSTAPFFKPLEETLDYEDAATVIFGASRRGRSHEQNGTFRDDDMGCWADEAAGRYLLVVADGAGSARYSREGSRQAVKHVLENLPSKLTSDVWEKDRMSGIDESMIGQYLVQEAHSAMYSIHDFCKTENAKPGVTDKLLLKDFNTTLLIAAAKRLEDGCMKVVSFSIGDGAIAWVSPRQTSLLCVPDGGEFSGQTRFLTTTSVWAKAAEDWGAFRRDRVFTTQLSERDVKEGFLVLMSDGVSDPFFETDSKLKSSEEWNKFVMSDADVDDGAKSLREIFKVPQVKDKSEQLMEWLGFWSKGNHDDRTILVMMDRNPAGIFFD